MNKFLQFVGKISEKHPVVEWALSAVICGVIVTVLVLIGLPGHWVSMQPQSFPGDVLIDLSMLPLALAVIMLIAFAWAVARIGWTEAGGTEYTLLLAIQWVVVIGIAFSRWHNGRTLYVAAAEALTLTALLNFALILLMSLVFTLIFILRLLRHGLVIMRETGGDLLRIWTCALLLCLFTLIGCWLLNGSGWLQPAL